jgi:hypothetical protein
MESQNSKVVTCILMFRRANGPTACWSLGYQTQTYKIYHFFLLYVLASSLEEEEEEEEEEEDEVLNRNSSLKVLKAISETACS